MFSRRVARGHQTQASIKIFVRGHSTYWRERDGIKKKMVDTVHPTQEGINGPSPGTKNICEFALTCDIIILVRNLDLRR